MSKRCLFLLVAGAMVTACAAPVIPLHQYLLDYPTLGNANLTSSAEAPSLVIDQVDIAAFLNSSGIIFQTADNEIAVASRHRWAEPLERQLRRSLYAVLVKRLDRMSVFERPPAVAGAAELSVALDAFHGRYIGDAVIAGTWRLTSSTGEVLARRRFRLVRPLPNDGYDALVQALSSGWQVIAARIAQQVTAAVAAP